MATPPVSSSSSSSSLSSHHAPSGFRNPWPSKTTLSSFLHIPFTRSKASPTSTPIEPVRTVPCDLRPYSDEEAENGKQEIHATWLGHAGFLVQFAGIRILFDPIFAERASPVTWFGPKRYLPTCCQTKDLPKIDFVVISHNHYDHLDIECLKQVTLNSPEVRFLVPLRVKQTIVDELSILEEGRVTEMDWWDVFQSKGLEFICTPAQHNSGRGIIDQSKSLWASWVVRTASQDTSVYFAGDTGYLGCTAFGEIGQRYGPFDLAMIPIWRGASLSVLGRVGLRLTESATSLLATLHATPSDAVQLFKDVRAKRAIAMHFGTFCGSEDEAKEPLELLVAELERQEISLLRERWEGQGFGYVNVGETVCVPARAESLAPSSSTSSDISSTVLS
ncbi:beta-lactamase superfamily domain-containing protein [Crepidotus variabilis]|uniref:Beta-lactamase superfamily domain-containing protein n=1 Tax=Crepidotus variabilis TaxID=179855 RepID=A0A9P6EVH1_9AGAR|nr:beta-lactamase superfamily domain-containing protein [Crepidotus variabilis]